jgi:hypothetical protein
MIPVGKENQMKIQRLRNLTTGKLHTKMEDIYLDLEFFIGDKGIMTHCLPNACKALEPFLREQFTDGKFWNGQFDQSHTGEVEVRPMNSVEKEKWLESYRSMGSVLV